MSHTSDAGTLVPHALALIDDERRIEALAHPHWSGIAQESDPALQLAWMVRQGLLTYDELDDLQTLDEEPSEADRIVEEAFAELGRQHTIANGRLFDQLPCDGLITPEQHGTMRARQLEERHDVASLLSSLVHEAVMAPDDFHALHAEVLAEHACGTDTRQRQPARATHELLKPDEA